MSTRYRKKSYKKNTTIRRKPSRKNSSTRRKSYKKNFSKKSFRGGTCYGSGVGANSYNPNFSIYNTRELQLFPYKA